MYGYRFGMMCPALEIAGFWSCADGGLGNTHPDYFMGWVFLVLYSPGLRSPISGVKGSTTYYCSAILHKPHSTENKTPRLMVKTTLNSYNFQRKSHIYKEKKRGKRIKAGVKSEESAIKPTLETSRK